MNKKQKNRKLIAQNLRNRMVNRRYSSTIKTLGKLMKTKIKSYNFEDDSKKKLENKENLIDIFKKLTSIFDKAVKKKIVHKNTAARKKSNFRKQLNQFQKTI